MGAQCTDTKQGIVYFVSHKDLWKPLTAKLAPTLTLSVGVTTFMVGGPLSRLLLEHDG